MRSKTHALETIPRFDFAGTAYSHGWYALAPNRGDPEERSLERTWKVGDGAARIRLSQPAGPGGRVEMEVLSGRGSRSGLPATMWRAIERDVRHMLRLDEDLSAFHALCRRAGPPFDRAADARLRAPPAISDPVRRPGQGAGYDEHAMVRNQGHGLQAGRSGGRGRRVPGAGAGGRAGRRADPRPRALGIPGPVSGGAGEGDRERETGLSAGGSPGRARRTSWKRRSGPFPGSARTRPPTSSRFSADTIGSAWTRSSASSSAGRISRARGSRSPIGGC